MLIIIEGLDKCGKSTLAEYLDQTIGAEIRHCDKPTRHPLEEYVGDLLDYKPGTGRHIVYDRHCWGERVWPTIFGRESLYTDEMHAHTENFLKSKGALFVLAADRSKNIIKRLIEDDDPYPPHDKVQEALDLFHEVARASSLPCAPYNISDFIGVNDLIPGGMERRADTMITEAQHLEEAAKWM